MYQSVLRSREAEENGREAAVAIKANREAARSRMEDAEIDDLQQQDDGTTEDRTENIPVWNTITASGAGNGAARTEAIAQHRIARKAADAELADYNSPAKKLQRRVAAKESEHASRAADTEATATNPVSSRTNKLAKD